MGSRAIRICDRLKPTPLCFGAVGRRTCSESGLAPGAGQTQSSPGRRCTRLGFLLELDGHPIRPAISLERLKLYLKLTCGSAGTFLCLMVSVLPLPVAN